MYGRILWERSLGLPGGEFAAIPSLFSTSDLVVIQPLTLSEPNDPTAPEPVVLFPPNSDNLQFFPTSLLSAHAHCLGFPSATPISYALLDLLRLVLRT